MILRASEVEARMRALPRRASVFQAGVSSIDGSPVPLSSLWGRWKPPMPQG